jgi:hypothetical protein
MLTFALAVYAAYVLHDPSRQTAATTRARAWAVIACIPELSIRTFEARVRLVSEETEGPFLFADYRERANERRSNRFEGKQRFYGSTPEGQRALMERELLECSVDGLLMGRNELSGITVTRPEQPDIMFSWGTPGPFRGLGRGMLLDEIEIRLEHLMGAEDLRITAESAERVVLAAGGVQAGRPFEHRVTIDPKSGLIERHQQWDLAWNHVTADWALTRWGDVGGLAVPTTVEYRLSTRKPLEKGVETELELRCGEAGIDAAALDARHPEFARWCAVRDKVLGPGGAPVRLLAPAQIATIEYVWINTPPDGKPPVFSLASTEGPFLSAFIEGPTDGPTPVAKANMPTPPAPSKASAPPGDREMGGTR